MIIYRAYEQLKAFYNNVSGTGKKKLSRSRHTILTYLTISQVVSGKGLLFPTWYEGPFVIIVCIDIEQELIANTNKTNKNDGLL